MIAAPQSEPYPMNRDRILVLDDKRSSFIVSILSLDGYSIHHFESGERALVELYENPPHLIVSKQLQLASTGQSLCQHVRDLKNFPYIPILLIADQAATDLVQSLDSGADDFLRQPIEVDELLARVRSLLRMKHSIDEREQITKVREEFLSRLTHDLRTPLVAADRMFSRLTQGKYGRLNPEVLDVLQSMQSNNQDLLQMTNTLLDIYRYEAGSKTLSFTIFNILELLKSIHQELLPLADSKNIYLKLNVDQAESATGLSMTISWQICAVKLEIRRMLTNLISNAIQFTETGGVEVILQAQAEQYQIQINDTGCGIPTTDLPHIFDRFYQGKNCLSGYGLGLNLVQQIMTAHHGQIKVSSTPQHGSCFTLTLPATANNTSTVWE